jgi:8-oxo-dGTP pyrophosphatase MutT (NUDIX family)
VSKNIPEIIAKKTLCKGKFVRFILSSYSDSSGAIREWEFFERVNCHGIVAIVPVTDQREFILIRQFRPPVNGYVIEFPAGLNDRRETPEDAARRELLEETGYTAREMIFLTDGPLSSGASGEILAVFLAKGIVFRGIGQRDETEDIEVLVVPEDAIYEQLSRLRSAGNYIDLKIYGLIELARKYF